MTREQMEAWCALEGLELCTFDAETVPAHIYRLVPAPARAWSCPMLSYSGYWHYATMGDPSHYRPIPWADLPDRVFNDLLSIDILTELTKK